MTIHLTRDLEDLHQSLLSMCGMVEEMIHEAVAGLSSPSYEAADILEQKDNEIDRRDVRIEEDCLKILALHQPVAIDLRRITTVLKISAELERVADLGVHIAERTCALVNSPEIAVPNKLRQMAGTAVDMLHRSIDAYVQLDSHLAGIVCRDDDIVDRLNREIIGGLLDDIRQNPDQLDAAIHLFSASRHVERVADHATNIAEDVIYLVEGTIVRHQGHKEERSQNTSS